MPDRANFRRGPGDFAYRPKHESGCDGSFAARATRSETRQTPVNAQIVSTERGVVLATKFLWYVSEKARSDAGFFMSDGGGRGRAQADLMPAQPEPFASVRQGEAACNLYNIATNMMRGRRERATAEGRRPARHVLDAAFGTEFT